ncbi:MAG: helix-turn-helix domain-containing protein, partial [Cytophagales bacterium]|nr:helix-turn-helix domain-containing protein [Cytophagales bacterium]
SGRGTVKSDLAEYPYGPHTVLFFSPYQPFRLRPAGGVAGTALHFHPDFFCIEKHKAEVACNGVLFNNIYQPPGIVLSPGDVRTFEDLYEKMRAEMQHPAIAQTELLVAYLKILLIQASRIKINQHPQAATDAAGSEEPFVLQKLKELIEKHYRQKHTPGAYADLLHITPKALGKIAKAHFHKTLTELIGERIVIEAKRELYLTGKPVKQIAYELGFGDEYYFSRFFKKNAAVSPQTYREKVGYDRAGSLSIPPPHPSMSGRHPTL